MRRMQKGTGEWRTYWQVKQQHQKQEVTEPCDEQKLHERMTFYDGRFLNKPVSPNRGPPTDFQGSTTFVCIRWKQNSEIPNYRRGGPVCKRQRIERNSRIQATGQHKIWLMWTTTCLFILSKISKIQLSRL